MQPLSHAPSPTWPQISMILVVSQGDLVPELLCLPIMDPCCVSCSGCPFPIPQNHCDPTGVPGTSPGAPISYQPPPAAPGAKPLWSAVPSVPVQGTQASATAESLMWPPSLEGDSGETAVERTSPVLPCLQPHGHPRQGGGWHCHPPSQGCPWLPAHGGAATPSAGQGGSVCTLRLCTQLPAVTITLPC